MSLRKKRASALPTANPKFGRKISWRLRSGWQRRRSATCCARVARADAGESSAIAVVWLPKFKSTSGNNMVTRLKVLISFALPQRWVEQLRTEFPEVEFLQTRDQAEQARFVAETDVIYGFRDQELAAQAPRLKWLHYYGAGVDGLDAEHFEKH